MILNHKKTTTKHPNISNCNPQNTPQSQMIIIHKIKHPIIPNSKLHPTIPNDSKSKQKHKIKHLIIQNHNPKTPKLKMIQNHHKNTNFPTPKTPQNKNFSQPNNITETKPRKHNLGLHKKINNIHHKLLRFA